MKISDIKEFKKINNSEIFFDFDIKKLNWFNIGGKSKVFYKPKNLRELKDFLKMYSNRSKVFVLGAGSNVLFKDSIYEGVIIKLSSNFSSISKLDNDKIIAGSSCFQKKFLNLQWKMILLDLNLCIVFPEQLEEELR